MEDVVRSFFRNLNGSRREIPRTMSGSIRFDIRDGKRLEHWLVTLSNGTVSSVESNEEAECIVQTDKDNLRAIVEGRMNAMAAMLRGVIVAEGRTLPMVIFRRLLYTPVTPPAEIAPAGYARRQT